MIFDQDQTPRAPAEAYYEVARWLGADYFTGPTPQAGRLVVVVGCDGVETRWHLTNADAVRFTDWCWDKPHLAMLRSVPYDRRQVTP